MAAFSPNPLIVTLAPASASALAMLSPMPEVDPVTTADFPLSMVNVLRLKGIWGATPDAAPQYNRRYGILRALIRYLRRPRFGFEKVTVREYNPCRWQASFRLPITTTPAAARTPWRMPKRCAPSAANG